MSRMSLRRAPDCISSAVNSSETGTLIRFSIGADDAEVRLEVGAAAAAEAVAAAGADEFLAGAGSTREIRVEEPDVTTAALGGVAAAVGGSAGDGIDMSNGALSFFLKPNIRASFWPKPGRSAGDSWTGTPPLPPKEPDDIALLADA
ncbi:MAG TPA: hypothetical protein VF720_07585, partial [Candidatus Eisenbacteria bacterium]